MEREKSLIKNSFIIGMGVFLPKLASIVTLPIVTGYLTKTEYGTYDLILILISLVLPVATLQIASAAFRFLIEARENQIICSKYISNILLFTILMSIIPLIIIFFVINNYGIGTRFLICFYFWFDILLATLQQINRGLGKNNLYSISTVLNAFLNMIMVIVLIRYMHMGLQGVIGSLVLSNGITCCFLMFGCHIGRYIKISFFDREVIKELLAFSWPMIPNNLSAWVMTLSDRLLLSLFLGVEVNAAYAVAKKIPNLLSSVQSTFSMAWQENASISSKDSDIDMYYTIMFDNVTNITVGACALLVGMSPVLFSILIKGDYKESYSQMPILFLGMAFITLASYQAGIYIADKKTKEIGITTVIAALINLVIDLIAIPIMGMYAASISTLISYFFLFSYRLVDLKKYHNISYKYKKIVILLFGLTLMCALSALNIGWMNWILLSAGVIIPICLNRELLKHIIKKIMKRSKQN